MFAKINRLKNWQVAIIILVVGFLIFSVGLNNPFRADDITQIVNNNPVHSISNIKSFFEGSTFTSYSNSNILTGGNFRPLMTTTYALLYTLFGPHPLYFHLLQLLLYLGSAFILFLFFRYSFNTVLALLLSLLFLIHPLNSQVVYSIPSMEDALFFFFGILAIWLLLRFQSVKYLILVAACLLLALFSKETAAVFVIMALVFLFWRDRRRFLPFIGIIVLPTTLYLILKAHAVGLSVANSNQASIEKLNLIGRLLTDPAIILFYFTKFIFPFKLATGYYFTYPHFSISHTLIPLLIDLAIIALIVYIGSLVHKKASKAIYFTYIFFTAWLTIGLLTTLQLVPLDMTACETWFYFPMVGLLGMVGITISVLKPYKYINQKILISLIFMLLLILGVVSVIRGTNYSSQYNLAFHDIQSSKEDYIAYNTVATYLYNQNRIQAAKKYAEQSIALFPNQNNLATLGIIENTEGNYLLAEQTYIKAISEGYTSAQLNQKLYEDTGLIMLWEGHPIYNINFIKHGLSLYPNDSTLWIYLAVIQENNNDKTDAKVSIANAVKNGQVPTSIVYGIISNTPFTVSIYGTNKLVQVK